MAEADMDAAAQVAADELHAKLKTWCALDISKWWARHYMTAGHKRLGRILVTVAKETPE